MLPQSLGILFYIRNDKLRSDGKAPIYLRITVNGKRAEYSIKRFVDPKKWNTDAMAVRGTKEETKTLNSYLEVIRNNIHKYLKELAEEGEVVSAIVLKNKLTGKHKQQKTLMEVYKYHNHLIKLGLDIEYAKATLTRYDTSLKHVSEFLMEKYKTDDIPLNKLDFEFITSFDLFLRITRKCNHNTTIKYIKNLKKVINFSINNSWLDKDPFRQFKLKLKDVKRDFLTMEELEAIKNKEFPMERLQRVRDIFLFACYTGLAYTDIEKLTKDNISLGIDGEKWIFTDRRKTGIASNIPLLPKALEILEKYSDHPLSKNTDKLLPVLSNQKLNNYLKDIADSCGIKKNLTFHVARHTFATTVTLLNGVPMESVSSMLGHKSLRTTQIYAKVVEKKVSEDMNKLRERLSGKSGQKKKRKNHG